MRIQFKNNSDPQHCLCIINVFLMDSVDCLKSTIKKKLDGKSEIYFSTFGFLKGTQTQLISDNTQVGDTWLLVIHVLIFWPGNIIIVYFRHKNLLLQHTVYMCFITHCHKTQFKKIMFLLMYLLVRYSLLLGSDNFYS